MSLMTYGSCNTVVEYAANTGLCKEHVRGDVWLLAVAVLQWWQAD
jgi:hypothetical protein